MCHRNPNRDRSKLIERERDRESERGRDTYKMKQRQARTMREEIRCQDNNNGGVCITVCMSSTKWTHCGARNTFELRHNPPPPPPIGPISSFKPHPFTTSSTTTSSFSSSSSSRCLLQLPIRERKPDSSDRWSTPSTSLHPSGFWFAASRNRLC